MCCRAAREARLHRSLAKSDEPPVDRGPTRAEAVGAVHSASLDGDGTGSGAGSSGRPDCAEYRSSRSRNDEGGARVLTSSVSFEHHQLHQHHSGAALSSHLGDDWHRCGRQQIRCRNRDSRCASAGENGGQSARSRSGSHVSGTKEKWREGERNPLRVAPLLLCDRDPLEVRRGRHPAAAYARRFAVLTWNQHAIIT